MGRGSSADMDPWGEHRRRSIGGERAAHELGQWKNAAEFRNRSRSLSGQDVVKELLRDYRMEISDQRKRQDSENSTQDYSAVQNSIDSQVKSPADRHSLFSHRKHEKLPTYDHNYNQPTQENRNLPQQNHNPASQASPTSPSSPTSPASPSNFIPDRYFGYGPPNVTRVDSNMSSHSYIQNTETQDKSSHSVSQNYSMQNSSYSQSSSQGPGVLHRQSVPEHRNSSPPHISNHVDEGGHDRQHSWDGVADQDNGQVQTFCVPTQKVRSGSQLPSTYTDPRRHSYGHPSSQHQPYVESYSSQLEHSHYLTPNGYSEVVRQASASANSHGRSQSSQSYAMQSGHSPHGQFQSPDGHNQSHSRHGQSPERHNQSSSRHSQSPEKHNQSSSRHGQSPVRHNQSHSRHGQNPERHNQSPRVYDRSPQSPERSPNSSHNLSVDEFLYANADERAPMIDPNNPVDQKSHSQRAVKEFLYSDPSQRSQTEVYKPHMGVSAVERGSPRSQLRQKGRRAERAQQQGAPLSSSYSVGLPDHIHQWAPLGTSSLKKGQSPSNNPGLQSAGSSRGKPSSATSLGVKPRSSSAEPINKHPSTQKQEKHTPSPNSSTSSNSFVVKKVVRKDNVIRIPGSGPKSRSYLPEQRRSGSKNQHKATPNSSSTSPQSGSRSKNSSQRHHSSTTPNRNPNGSSPDRSGSGNPNRNSMGHVPSPERSSYGNPIRHSKGHVPSPERSGSGNPNRHSVSHVPSPERQGGDSRQYSSHRQHSAGQNAHQYSSSHIPYMKDSDRTSNRQLNHANISYGASPGRKYTLSPDRHSDNEYQTHKHTNPRTHQMRISPITHSDNEYQGGRLRRNSAKRQNSAVNDVVRRTDMYPQDDISEHDTMDHAVVMRTDLPPGRHLTDTGNRYSINGQEHYPAPQPYSVGNPPSSHSIHHNMPYSKDDGSVNVRRRHRPRHQRSKSMEVTPQDLQALDEFTKRASFSPGVNLNSESMPAREKVKKKLFTVYSDSPAPLSPISAKVVIQGPGPRSPLGPGPSVIIGPSRNISPKVEVNPTETSGPFLLSPHNTKEVPNHLQGPLQGRLPPEGSCVQSSSQIPDHSHINTENGVRFV